MSLRKLRAIEDVIFYHRISQDSRYTAENRRKAESIVDKLVRKFKITYKDISDYKKRHQKK